MKGKRVQFDDETWAALDLLSRESMRDFQELAEEAFRDLLKKHGRPSAEGGAAAKRGPEREHPPTAHKEEESAERPPAGKVTPRGTST